jgi:hypothetical protein
MSKITITYAARKLPGGEGWIPQTTQVCDGGKPQHNWSRRLRGFDRDTALEKAHDDAKALASRYVGDWDVVVEEGADVT